MSDRRMNRTDSRPDAVAKQLQHVAREGDCDLIVVAAKDGALVGTGEEMSKDSATTLARLASQAFQMRDHAEEILSVKAAEEFTLTSSGSCSVLCRFFHFRGNPLAAIVRTCGRDFEPELLGRIEAGVVRVLKAKDLDLARVERRAADPVPPA